MYPAKELVLKVCIVRQTAANWPEKAGSIYIQTTKPQQAKPTIKTEILELKVPHLYSLTCSFIG